MMKYAGQLLFANSAVWLNNYMKNVFPLLLLLQLVAHMGEIEQPWVSLTVKYYHVCIRLKALFTCLLFQ